MDVCSYEAQRMFIELDNLREAAKFKRGKVSRRPRILMTIRTSKYKTLIPFRAIRAV